MSHQFWSTLVSSEKLLSIVTVTMNERSSLRTCISSLSPLIRDYAKQCEHIIIDGSQILDGEVDLEALGYSDISSGNPVANRRFLKESDDGLYHAMEKGVAASRGRYIWFLNDDDYLQSLDIAALTNFLADTAPEVLVGTIIYREIINGISVDREFYPQPISYEELILDGSLRRLPHPVTILKKIDWPLFDHRYTMIADYVALAAVLKRAIRTVAFPSLKVVMVRGEGQLSKKNRSKRNQEANKFLGSLLSDSKKPLRFRIRLGLWALGNWKAIVKKEVLLVLGYVKRFKL